MLGGFHAGVKAVCLSQSIIVWIRRWLMVVQAEKSYKLLVVDDEDDVAPMFRQSMRPEVRQGRYKLIFASSGVEALERLEQEQDVDLVITDINMPEMDGLTLLGRLSERSLDLRSVVLSAYGDMKNIRTAMSLGAFDFVSKPVDFDDMKETIERSLVNLEQWREALASRDQLISLRQELDLAGRIQRSSLPAEFPSVSGFDFHAVLQPAREVSGDFYDVMRLDGGRLGLVVADVSGKGVAAALFMMGTRTLLRGAAIGLGDPAQVLSEVNSLLCRDNVESMFVTVFICVLDPASGTLVYANAGHPPPLLARADGLVEALESAENMVLGLQPGVHYQSFSLSLEPGDAVFMYTDGVSEALDLSGEEFGEDRLARVLSGGGAGSAAGSCASVVEAVRVFASGEAELDDITCLALRRQP